MNTFQQKLKQLPQKAQDFFISSKAAEYNGLIIKKFSLDINQREGYMDIVEGLFFKEIKLSELAERIKKNLSFDADKAQELVRDIIGIKLLCTKDWFGPDLEATMKSVGGNLADYQKYVTEHEQSLIEEQVKEDEPYVFVPKKQEEAEYQSFNSLIEKQESIENFKGRLYNFLKSDENEIMVEYNLLLMKLMVDEPQVKRDLELALYDNLEILTSQNFALNGKLSAPTISNWLKDFISKNGSDNFDNVILSRYIANSPNVKVLSNEEKEIVKKLLRLYRNLKFFPESQTSEDVEQWEIIPVKHDFTGSVKPVKLTTPKSAEEKKADELSNLKDASSTDLEKKVLDEELGKNKEAQRLMMMARKFPEGSIERRALEDEVKKLNV